MTHSLISKSNVMWHYLSIKTWKKHQGREQIVLLYRTNIFISVNTHKESSTKLSLQFYLSACVAHISSSHHLDAVFLFFIYLFPSHRSSLRTAFFNFISVLFPWARQIHLDVAESRIIWLKAIWKLKSTTLSARITSAWPSKRIRTDSICIHILLAPFKNTYDWSGMPASPKHKQLWICESSKLTHGEKAAHIVYALTLKPLVNQHLTYSNLLI